MTEPSAAADAAEAAEAAAEAAEASAEAAEAEAVHDDGDDDDQADDGDTTVVVVNDDGDDDAQDAQDDATNLDHEQRITRLEERLDQLAADVISRPTHDDVRAMMPSPETVEQLAAQAGAEAAEATVEAIDEAEETGEPASVRIEEPPPSSDPLVDGGMVTVEPDAPAVTGGKKRPALFRW